MLVYTNSVDSVDYSISEYLFLLASKQLARELHPKIL